MRLKELKIFLQQLNGFDNPKIQYEQYSTPWELASQMLYTIDTTYNDINGKMIADLGCGCGMFTIGCAALGANCVVGFDIDDDALDICFNNIQELNDDEHSCIDLIRTDITNDNFMNKFEGIFDTVIMNPPFGTKGNRGIDMIFLKRALQLATKSVYSLHKSSTREHILKKSRDWGVKANVVSQLRYDIPSLYKFHRHSSVDIEVDMIRFTFS